jgi:hypothetical protein
VLLVVTVLLLKHNFILLISPFALAYSQFFISQKVKSSSYSKHKHYIPHIYLKDKKFGIEATRPRQPKNTGKIHSPHINQGYGSQSASFYQQLELGSVNFSS